MDINTYSASLIMQEVLNIYEPALPPGLASRVRSMNPATISVTLTIWKMPEAQNTCVKATICAGTPCVELPISSPFIPLASMMRPSNIRIAITR